MQTKSPTAKRLSRGIAMIFVLSLCLALTTFALVYSMVAVEGNLFVTGTVKLNLNDGKAIINENEFLFEPGMTVKKDFFLLNESSCDIYYKLYFRNVTGSLADVLEVRILDGEKLLYEGSPNELTRENVLAADDSLKLNEKRELQIVFHFPEEAGNAAQNAFLSFDFAADGVQMKNNPDKIFH